MFSFLRFLIVIVLTVYAGILYENEAIVLLGFMEATLFVVSAIWAIYQKITLKYDLSVPVGIAETGKGNLVKINVYNNCFIPVTRMKAYLRIVNVMSGRKNKYIMNMSGAHKGVSSFGSNVFFEKFGEYEVHSKKIRIYDVTGLFHIDIRRKMNVNIEVIPKLNYVPVNITLGTRNFYGEANVYDEHTPGYDNNEIFQIREYQKGDKLQSVHWKMSAKQEDIVVKDPSLPKACAVVLIIDFNDEKLLKKENAVEDFMEAAVSISFSIMDAKCCHYVAWYDSVEGRMNRLRVDDEESMFYCIGTLMKVLWKEKDIDLVEEYKHEYKNEPFIYALSINENLELTKNGTVVAKYSGEDLSTSLSQVEILL
ncbi:MAG: DUF58 domain-containing protein [Lachnospiraceae bacterium]|nr:DUF58 domain-containing protein [Lachnospiraceae bacterium]